MREFSLKTEYLAQQSNIERRYLMIK